MRKSKLWRPFTNEIYQEYYIGMEDGRDYIGARSGVKQILMTNKIIFRRAHGFRSAILYEVPFMIDEDGRKKWIRAENYVSISKLPAVNFIECNKCHHNLLKEPNLSEYPDLYLKFRCPVCGHTTFIYYDGFIALEISSEQILTIIDEYKCNRIIIDDLLHMYSAVGNLLEVFERDEIETKNVITSLQSLYERMSEVLGETANEIKESFI